MTKKELETLRRRFRKKRKAVQGQGGRKTAESKGAVYMQQIGTKGGLVTFLRHGPEHFKRMRQIREENRRKKNAEQKEG